MLIKTIYSFFKYFLTQPINYGNLTVAKPIKFDCFKSFNGLEILKCILCVLIVCVDALCPSQQFFSHARMVYWVEPVLSQE